MPRVQFLNREEFFDRIQSVEKNPKSDLGPEIGENGNMNFPGLRKHLIPEKVECVKVSKDGDPDNLVDSRIIEFTVSTTSRDRDGDILEVDGFDLDNYKKNPVVLFAHDSRRPPIGRAVDIHIEKKSLVSRTEFMDVDVDISGFSDMIYRMVKGGFLKATSVGFLPIEVDLIQEDKKSNGVSGFHIKKMELLEYSIVPIPANPEALMRAKGAGINIAPLDSWFEEALDRWADYKNMLLVPKSYASKLYKMVHQEVKGTGEVTVSIAKPLESKSKYDIDPAEAKWDEKSEVENAGPDDLAVMSAWSKVDALDPSKTNYRLIHHRSSGGNNVVLAGVTESIALLAGAEDGVDIPKEDRIKAWEHLSEHLKKDFGIDPPDPDLVMNEVLTPSRKFYPVVFGTEYAFDLETGEFHKVFESDDDSGHRKIIDDDLVKSMVKKHLEYLFSLKDPETSEKSIVDLMKFLEIDTSAADPGEKSEEPAMTNGENIVTWKHVGSESDAETGNIDDTDSTCQEKTVELVLDEGTVDSPSQPSDGEMVKTESAEEEKSEVDASENSNKTEAGTAERVIDEKDKKSDNAPDNNLGNIINTASIRIGDVEVNISMSDGSKLGEIISRVLATTGSKNPAKGVDTGESKEDNHSDDGVDSDNVETGSGAEKAQDDEIDINEVKVMIEEIMPELVIEFKEMVRKRRTGNLDDYI